MRHAASHPHTNASLHSNRSAATGPRCAVDLLLGLALLVALGLVTGALWFAIDLTSAALRS